MLYEDTVPMTRDEYKASAKAIGHIQAKFDEKTLKKKMDKQPLRNSKWKRNVVTSDDEEELDLKALLEESGRPAKISKMENNVQKPKVKTCSICLKSLDFILKRELK